MQFVRILNCFGIIKVFKKTNYLGLVLKVNNMNKFFVFAYNVKIGIGNRTSLPAKQVVL